MVISAGSLPRVYLAGKVGHTDWRHGLFPLRHVELRYDRAADRLVLNQEPLRRDGFEYVGPYFVSDDHGCFHGPSQHGLIDPGFADGQNMSDPNFPQKLRRRTVMRSCLGWLDQADAVFCWLSSHDAFGTLVEIGYAKARGIPVYVATDGEVDRGWDEVIHGPKDPYRPHLPMDEIRECYPGGPWAEFWFAGEVADSFDREWSAAAAWEGFCQWWAREMAPTWAARRLIRERVACHTHRH